MGHDTTDRWALAAVGMIWEHLPRAWRDGADLAAREQMALASTYAGLAFTRANVGNVHAIAHQLGGRYHVPHGLANAIMLPPVLRFSLPDAAPRLARLARHVGLAGRGDPALAKALRRRRAGARTMRCRSRARWPRCARRTSTALADAACHEADFNYPVPRRMTPADCAALLRQVLPAASAAAASRGLSAAPRPPARPPSPNSRASAPVPAACARCGR